MQIATKQDSPTISGRTPRPNVTPESKFGSMAASVSQQFVFCLGATRGRGHPAKIAAGTINTPKMWH
ncbi:hypothetical protein RBSWK_01489 [Rhodopirellula baltica SWK14]|uniref:Uncharacterized protein n=1 Tax=Rhodopirellula baltica SWK14 TaxID=993516 RepID=L7CL69_RHOBT|nr:hypothetical protein RBSWK_01489 [Rhodopirellula baltica SWK14]